MFAVISTPLWPRCSEIILRSTPLLRRRVALQWRSLWRVISSNSVVEHLYEVVVYSCISVLWNNSHCDHPPSWINVRGMPLTPSLLIGKLPVWMLSGIRIFQNFFQKKLPAENNLQVMKWSIMLCAGNIREPDRGVGGINGVGMRIEWEWDGEDGEKVIF